LLKSYTQSYTINFFHYKTVMAARITAAPIKHKLLGQILRTAAETSGL